MLSSLFWAFSNTFSVQIINFIVVIVLARILQPSDFGIIAMIAIFISVGKYLKDAGMTSSLIRTTDYDQVDLNVVFYTNLLFSCSLYLIIFFSAPYVAKFYKKDILVDVLRLYALVLPIGAIGSIQYTLLTKELKFKTQLVISIPSLIIGGMIGIILAWQDFGVWSLVWMNIVQSAFNSLQLCFYRRWVPTFKVEWSVLKHHFSFGIRLTLSSLLEVIYNNIYTVVIGKFFSAKTLGFYDRANSLKQLPVNNLTSALSKVSYPMFSEIKSDDSKLRSYYKLIFQEIIFVLMPVLGVAAIVAKPLFEIVLGEKWLPAVPYFQLLCLVGLFYPLNGYNLNILKVKGRSDIYLKLALINKVIGVIFLVAGLQFGIYGLLVAQVISTVSSLIINSWTSGRFISYQLFDQLRDISAVFILNCVLLIIFFVVYSNFLSNTNSYVLVVLLPIAYLLIYIPLSNLFKFSALIYLKSKIL